MNIFIHISTRESFCYFTFTAFGNKALAADVRTIGLSKPLVVLFFFLTTVLIKLLFNLLSLSNSCLGKTYKFFLSLSKSLIFNSSILLAFVITSSHIVLRVSYSFGVSSVVITSSCLTLLV